MPSRAMGSEPANLDHNGEGIIYISSPFINRVPSNLLFEEIELFAADLAATGTALPWRSSLGSSRPLGPGPLTQAREVSVAAVEEVSASRPRRP